MQTVFEKIIEELEKLDVKAIKRYKGGTFGDYEGTDYYIKKSDAIEIVKQEAEKYNNGWIPVSERLPENISTVILQVKEIEKPTFGWYGNMDGWRLTEKDFVELKDFTVVAWKPLPEPYQPKGE